MKRLQNQITLLKDKLAQYDEEFAELKTKTASEDIEEVR